MAAGIGHPHSPLIDNLLAEPQGYNFFVAVRFLERVLRDKVEVGSGASPREEALRFLPSTGLSFPGSDLVAAEWRDSDADQFRLTVSFLGLYGVASPLPAYFQQIAAGDDAGAVLLRDFLNLFNQRIYAFYYRAWKKHRLADSWDSRATRGERFLAALGGLAGMESVPQLLPYRVHASAGLLGAAVRSARGLESVLAEYFRLPVRVQEWLALWRDNPSPTQLGDRSHKLGRSVALGTRIRDAAGSFRITVGPMHMNDAESFMPGSAGHTQLAALVKLLVTDYLRYELCICVHGFEAPLARLGSDTAPLGWLCWLGKPAEDLQCVSVGTFDTC